MNMNRRAFTLMELLVVLAILLILAAIAIPVHKSIRARTNMAEATRRMSQIGVACIKFMGEHDNELPGEDMPGKDSWQAATTPESADVWYNVLPRLCASKGVGDYAAQPEGFYDKGNILYLPGAGYPASEKKLGEPLFAYAINSRLQRKDVEGVKNKVRATAIAQPARTVLFLERGIRGEKRANKAAPGYDGRAKASGRAFVARYNDRGILLFADGHTQLVAPEEVMDSAGRLHYPQTSIIWTSNPENDPN